MKRFDLRARLNKDQLFAIVSDKVSFQLRIPCRHQLLALVCDKVLLKLGMPRSAKYPSNTLLHSTAQVSPT